MPPDEEPFQPSDYEAEVERLRPRLEVWATARMGASLRAAMEPEDVAASVLVEVHRDRASFRGATRGAFRAWVFRIADTTLKDLADRVGAQKRSPVELPRRAITTPSQAAARREDVLRLRHALTLLGEEHREVIRLVRLEGRSAAEVGGLLGCSANAVRIRLCRALQALGSHLDPSTP